MVCSLLSMLGTHDPEDMSQTLLAMSASADSCAALKQSGCIPLLIEVCRSCDLMVSTAHDVCTDRCVRANGFSAHLWW